LRNVAQDLAPYGFKPMNYTGWIDPLGPFEPRIESPKSNLPNRISHSKPESTSDVSQVPE
jgi:hypothetical protein